MLMFDSPETKVRPGFVLPSQFPPTIELKLPVAGKKNR
jgi:hypothetical protein